YFRGQDRSRGRARRPSSRPVISVTFPVSKGLSTFVCPAGLHLPRAPSRSGSPLGVEELGRGVQGDTVSTGSLFLKEVTMANKDKGGSKSSKTAASKSLKEKREAKKAKAAGSGSSSSANWTKK
ncbi:MAG: hypothetical protein ACREJK_08370, partial [Candidatus Methylomirabilales bacterium]